MSDTLPEREDQKGWLECCQGYTHAPWCLEYEEPDERCPFTRTWVPDPCVLPKGHTGKHMNAVEQTIATSTHQPAARSGGDEWHMKVAEANVYILDQNGNAIANLHNERIAREIIERRNQHQSLVAERERLRAALLNAKRCLERSDRSQLSIRKAIEKADTALNEQRSTSE